MEATTPPMKTAPRPALHWSWILVIACGLLLGYYFLQTYISPRTRQYQLDFGRAYWIEPAKRPAPIAYFRKEIHLATRPEQAWIEVAASDTFGLTVNGHTLGTEGSVKTYETGIYDIKRALKEGTNVIAVSVSRTSFPGPAQLLLRGQITEPGGNTTSILSDESWRVSNHTGIVAGTIDWNSQRVEEELWPHARLSQLNGEKVPLRWVDMNPLLLQLPLRGQWIMAPNAAPEAVFSTVIQADHDRQETWIQLASSGDLDLAVNGHIVTVASTAAAGGKRLPHLATTEPVPVTPIKPGRTSDRTTLSKKEGGSPFESVTLSAYDISRWIRGGSNQIVVAVRSDHVPAALFTDGFVVESRDKVRQFASSSDWSLGDQAGRAGGVTQQHPIELGKNGVTPWGYLPQELARPLDRSGFATVFESWLVVGLIVALVLVIWLVVSAVVAGWRNESFLDAMSRDALLHGPVAVGLLLLLLPNFDPRFPIEWSFRPLFVVGAFAVLLLIRLFHLLIDRWTPAVNQAGIERIKAGARWEQRKVQTRELVSKKLRLPEIFEIPFRQLLPYLILILIMFLGFGLRFHDLGYMSFDHDEMGLVAKSKGVLELGFPYTSFAGEIRWITTYEAVPYPLALSGFLFGYSEWSMRLPSCLMGTLCIGVMGLMGRRLFGWRTGLFAALIYACLPLNIRWAQNAFYPTQCQFIAMLTFWLFYEAIQLRPFHRKLLTAATVAFCLMYLSWEGTAFVLPALFLALVIVRWREWWWLKDFHLYRCLFFIAAVVIAQYCSRILAGIPYLQVGSGLSNLSGPSLFFLAPGYQPMFYVDKLFLSENHVFFTVMLLLGIPFCWRSPGFRYVVVLLTALFIAHTNFLAALSPRYAYYYQALLVLGGTAATVMLYDRVLALAERAGGSNVARLAAHATGLGLLALLFIQSNESVLKEYQLSSAGDAPQMMTRMNTYRYDYRGAARYVATHARPGDVIFPGIPHVFLNYAGFPGDYFMDTLYSSKVFYNQVLSDLQFADKFGGLPVIRDLSELKQVVSHSGRTWIVFAPYSSFEKLNAPAVLDYIHDNARTEFESYRTKVYLIEAARPEAAVAKTP
jgi:4-amino-4-deoxy-L-arabinose transferase-like glycosyltransferase